MKTDTKTLAERIRKMWPAENVSDSAFAKTANEAAQRLEELEAERSAALQTLWSVGQSPAHFDTLEKSTKAVVRSMAMLRDMLSNPPPDVQEKVLAMLGVNDRLIALNDEVERLKATTVPVEVVIEKDEERNGKTWHYAYLQRKGCFKVLCGCGRETAEEARQLAVYTIAVFHKAKEAQG